MKRLLRSALLLLLLALLVGCGNTYVPIEPEDDAAQDVVAPLELAGSSWVLAGLDGSLTLPGVRVSLAFGEDGTVSGTDGCNQFSGSYIQEGDSLTFALPMASTMMACEEAVMNQAATYMDTLATTTNFSASSAQLVLRAGDEIVATFLPESQGLAGSNWLVVAYNNGREAVVGLIDGTEITAGFGLDGQVSGSAGCNNYFADFTEDGDNLTIGPVATTFRFCETPPGVMEQESEFLTALSTVATFGMEGNLMVLRTADGAAAVHMTRQVLIDLPEPETTLPWGRVTAPNGINVRSGPGTHYPIIGFALFGDEGEIVGRSADNRWWAASVPSAPNGIGWVSADFVAVRNVEDVPIIAPAPPVIVPPVFPTAVATPTPVPPATPTPAAELSLTADSTSINQGQCTRINWSVQNVQAVWVYERGQPFDRYPRAGQGSMEVCPTVTTTYEMRVQLRDGSIVFREVTVNVSGPTPTPTAPPTATPVPPATPEPTATSIVDPLVNTRWEVTQFNDGNGITTLLPDTRATIEFAPDGQVSGNGGCNTYFGAYQVSGSDISISGLAATSQLCTEPEGIMEQEAALLDALQSSFAYRIDGSTLELRNGAGQIAVIATAMP